MPNNDPPARYANGRFGPGNPGRPPGARGRASHRVVMSILEDFEANKLKLLQSLRTRHSPAYFATLMRFLPPMIEEETPYHAACSEDEAKAMIAEARVAVACPQGVRVGLAQLESILATGRRVPRP